MNTKTITLPDCIPFPAARPQWATSINPANRQIKVWDGCQHFVERYLERTLKKTKLRAGHWQGGRIEIRQGWEGPVAGVVSLS